MSNFWDLRQCFLPPVPEHEAAADLLSAAADALLAGNLALARSYVVKADFPALRQHAQRIMSETKDIVRRRAVAGDPPAIGKIKQRMPSADVIREIQQRDGYRCRFCGCRIVLRQAREEMRRQFPGAIRWNEGHDDHGAFRAMTESIDHILPHSWGGTNERDNLVTACWPCQFGRMNARIEEVGILDPRQRDPVVDAWDGIGRLLTQRPDTQAKAITSERPSASSNILQLQDSPAAKTGGKDDQSNWLQHINRHDASLSARIFALIEANADLGITSSLNKVLVVNMKQGNANLTIMGINPDGSVEIPWQIGDYKKSFRIFCEYLSSGISGSQVRETPKLWTVEMTDRRKISVSQLLAAATPLRIALEKLHASLQS